MSNLPQAEWLAKGCGEAKSFNWTKRSSGREDKLAKGRLIQVMFGKGMPCDFDSISKKGETSREKTTERHGIGVIE